VKVVKGMNEALADSKDSTSAANSERESAGVDARGVGSRSRVGTQTKEVRSREKEVSTGSGSDRVASPKTQKERDEDSYVIDAGLKMLRVFEALEGRSFEPATITRVVQRTKLDRDFCRRALITLKKAGWAKQTFDGWVLGTKAENLARRYSSELLRSAPADQST
jgi:hypothetical protein